MRAILVALLSICVSAAAFGQTTTAKSHEPGEPPDAPPTFDTHDGSPATV